MGLRIGHLLTPVPLTLGKQALESGYANVKKTLRAL
jgi:hypothetical protein